MKRHVVAVDIGGSKTAFLARDLDGDVDIHVDKTKTPVGDGPEAIFRLLDEQLDRLPGGRRKMAALGVAVPGHVDPGGTVLRAGNLEGWVNLPLRAILEKRY